MANIGWTKEHIEELLELAKNPNLSAREIAERHSRPGITKNMALSKLHHLGVKLKNTRAKFGRGMAAQIARGTAGANLRRGAFRPPPSVEIPDEPPATEGVDIYNLATGMCKWPLGGGPPFLYCGEVVQKDKVYCKYHWHKATARVAEPAQRPIGARRSPTYVFRKQR